jgi:orotate phosphoribosyltransferase
LPEEVLALVSARSGHFLLESGHHGDLWLDLDTLSWRPVRLQPLAAELARRLGGHGVDVVCGPLVGGALVAQLVATALDAAFVHAERSVAGAVAYRIPNALRERLRGRRVAVVDDVVNAGSAVRGTLADLRVCGAVPVAIGALLLLGAAAERLTEDETLPVERLAVRPSGLWPAAACPLCSEGVPLERPHPPSSAGGSGGAGRLPF